MHRLTFVNNCKQTIWVGALTNGAAFALPEGGGWEIAPAGSHSIDLAGRWEGRFWGRTGCASTNGTFKCVTGDCGGLQCAGRGGQPTSLAEFTLYDDTGKDFYDLSLVDAFNLTMAIAPTANTFPAGIASGLTCTSSVCSTDINVLCPAELQQKDIAGQVVACLSACSAHNTDATCCRNAYDTSAACPATPLSQVFKTACRNAYSYAYDDRTSTYTCTATGYTVTFCPMP
jgi:hypothetical protein